MNIYHVAVVQLSKKGNVMCTILDKVVQCDSSVTAVHNHYKKLYPYFSVNVEQVETLDIKIPEGKVKYSTAFNVNEDKIDTEYSNLLKEHYKLRRDLTDSEAKIRHKVSSKYATQISKVTNIIIDEYGVKATLEFRNPVHVLVGITEEQV